MFAKLSPVEAMNLKIQVDNLFIIDYMPFAPESYVKVYLYGLSQASHNLDADNSVEKIAKRLDLDSETVTEAFSYWENCGIVRINEEPEKTVEYLPVRPASATSRKIPKGKYESFTVQLNSMITSRMISQSEFARYYDLMENLHFQPEAMLAVISHCIRLKGDSVSVNYITAVARNLAADGNLSYDSVHDALAQYDTNTANISEILKALKTSRKPDHEDRRIYLKWIKSYGFDLNTVLCVASTVKYGGMNRLDTLLTKYNELNLTTVAQIDEYVKKTNMLYELTKAIVKRLGLSIERLEYTIEIYTEKWLALGFDPDTLIAIAESRYKSGKRTLEAMNSTVNRYYAKGLVSKEAFAAYTKSDASISELLSIADSPRAVTDNDRDCYRTWKNDWGMSDEMLAKAAKSAAGKENAVAYMNKVLSVWHAQGATAPNEIKSDSLTVKKTYSEQELNEMFNSLTDDDI